MSHTIPSQRRWRRVLIVGLALAFAATPLLTWQVWRQRPLSPLAQACVGRWAFPLDAQRPDVRPVYELRSDGSVQEEHFYLNSPSPGPRLVMHGRWHLESDGTLVIQRAGGLSGLANEGARQMRRLLGQRQYEFKLLTRFYKLQQADPHRLVLTDSDENGPVTFEVLPHPAAQP